MLDLIDPQIEMATLGSVLIFPENYDKIISQILPNDFHDYRNRNIWNAFQYLKENQQRIDFLTVSSVLQSKGILEESGGISYLLVECPKFFKVMCIPIRTYCLTIDTMPIFSNNILES